MTDLEELERLARAATPGPWTTEEEYTIGDDTEIEHVAAADGKNVVTSDSGFYTSAADMRYIAAANPATILALVERVRSAEGASESWAEIAGEETARADRAEAELKALRERVEACPRYCGDGYKDFDGPYLWRSDVLAALEPVKP